MTKIFIYGTRLKKLYTNLENFVKCFTFVGEKL